MTGRTEPPDLKRHLAQLERRVEQMERQSRIRRTTQRPEELFVRRVGDTMTGSLTLAGAGTRLLRPSADGLLDMRAEGFEWRTAAGTFLASLDTTAVTKSWSYRTYDKNGVATRIEIDTANSLAEVRFTTSLDEQLDGRVYQYLYPGPGGGGGGANQAEIGLHPSILNDTGVRPEITIFSRSVDGTVAPKIRMLTGTNGTLDIRGAAWMRDDAVDRGWMVGSGGNCRAVNAANTAFRPIEASAFTVSSDPTVKRSIRPAPSGMTEALRSAKVIRYRMKEGWDDGRNAEQLGLDATTMPAAVQRQMPGGDSGDTITGYDTASALAWLTGVVKEIETRLGEVEAELVDTRERLAEAEARLAKE